MVFRGLGILGFLILSLFFFVLEVTALGSSVGIGSRTARPVGVVQVISWRVPSWNDPQVLVKNSLLAMLT